MSQEEIGRELHDHKCSKLNRENIRVKTVDERNADGAHHKYLIEVFTSKLTSDGVESVIETCAVNFQNGGLADVGPNGITEQALLAIVLDRLRGFQTGPYSSRENSIMITKLEEALMWSEKRANDRARRGVEGVRTA